MENMKKEDIKKKISKIWGRILCGKPRKSGNYSRYWGICDEKNDIFENDIFEIGFFRSIIVDLLDKEGQWASHPIDKFLNENKTNKKNNNRKILR